MPRPVTQPTFNLRHLRALCETVATGSFSSASRRVHLSQSAVTQAIAGLESGLDQTLFSRHATGVVATDAGRILAARAEHALELLRIGATKAQHLSPRTRVRGFSAFDRLITTAQIKALLAVAAAGNYSLAARQSGISQPSIHKAARDLERLSGVELFHNTPRGIQLTPAAEILVRHARLAEVELQQALAELDALRGTEGGTISIGTLPLARTKMLPKVINDFVTRHPKAQINVVDGPYEELLRGLRYGEIDILIGALRNPVPTNDVHQVRLFGDHLAIVARREHPLQHVPKLSVDMLREYSWIVPKQGTPTRTYFDKLFPRSGKKRVLTGLIETSSLVLIRGLLIDSDRLALISRQQVSIDVENGMLTYLSFMFAQKARPIGFTFRRDWRPTALQSEFVGMLKAAGGSITD